jgi:diadenylate cyclase
MLEIISNFYANLVFIFERLDWVNVVDLILVTMVFFGILLLVRGTLAMVLLRGALVFVALIAVLASFEVLPAFSWLVRVTIPAILFAIPVIFAPEIRHALERLGRAGTLIPSERHSQTVKDTISAIVYATARLSNRHHGAIIVIQRRDNLDEFIRTGVTLNAAISPELLLQIFYPNTPLHDGAVIVSDSHIIAAACVLPLSASGVLTESPERQMGLRHRAALGISEVSDAISIVISEEIGSISVVHGGRMIRRLDADRLENILGAFYRPSQRRSMLQSLVRLLPGRENNDQEAS